MGRAYSCWMLNWWCITWPVGFFFWRGPIYDTLETRLCVVAQILFSSQCEQLYIWLFGERLGRSCRRPTNQITRPWVPPNSKLWPVLPQDGAATSLGQTFLFHIKTKALTATCTKFPCTSVAMPHADLNWGCGNCWFGRGGPNAWPSSSPVWHFDFYVGRSSCKES